MNVLNMKTAASHDFQLSEAIFGPLDHVLPLHLGNTIINMYQHAYSKTKYMVSKYACWYILVIVSMLFRCSTWSVLGHQMKCSYHVLEHQMKHSCYALGHQMQFSRYILWHHKE
jgi:hypothetical protein